MNLKEWREIVREIERRNMTVSQVLQAEMVLEREKRKVIA